MTKRKEPNWEIIGQELSQLINRHGLDNHLSTPDFMLSDLLLRSLQLHREFLMERKKWFGPNPVTPEDFGGEL